jgi:single-strand DNA-binding protein
MSFNRVLLLGNLGADPELRYTQNQQPVCTLRIATSERRKGADGNWTDHTEWHSVVTFGKTAENAAQYLAKGRQVLVEGKIQTRKWQDKDGNNRYTTEVIANTVTFVGNKGEGSRGSTSDQSGFEAAPIAPIAAAETVAFDDDDIPF